MRADELFEIIGDIDAEKADAAVSIKKTRSINFAKWGAVAACFVIVTVLSVQTLRKEKTEVRDLVVDKTEHTEKQREETVPPQTEENSVAGTETDDALKENTEISSDEAYGAYDTDDSVAESGAAEKAVTQEAETEDSAYLDEPLLSGGGGGSSSSAMLMTVAEDVFGGSYVDAEGRCVVIITKDTPENRDAVADILGIDKDSAVFEKGEYTLAYLTQLQNKISAAAADGQIPFVVSAEITVQNNRLNVGVTTQNPDELEKVRRLDTASGAIVFECVNNE